jgi:hypothetical protein
MQWPASRPISHNAQVSGTTRPIIVYPFQSKKIHIALDNYHVHEVYHPCPAVQGPDAASSLSRAPRASDAWLPANTHPDPQLFASVTSCRTWLQCAQLLEAQAPGFDPMLLSALITKTVKIQHGIPEENITTRYQRTGNPGDNTRSNRRNCLQPLGPVVNLRTSTNKTIRSSEGSSWKVSHSSLSNDSSSSLADRFSQAAHLAAPPTPAPRSAVTSCNSRKSTTGTETKNTSSTNDYSSYSSSTSHSSNSACGSADLWKQPPSQSWRSYMDAVAALVLQRLGRV